MRDGTGKPRRIQSALVFEKRFILQVSRIRYVMYDDVFLVYACDLFFVEGAQQFALQRNVRLELLDLRLPPHAEGDSEVREQEMIVLGQEKQVLEVGLRPQVPFP